MDKNLPLPGLEVVGRGIYLRPNQPYELKRILFLQILTDKVYYSSETQQSYAMPDNYGVNNSPPMPNNKALNQLIIEESWEKMNHQTQLDSKVAMGNALFSVDASASKNNQVSSDGEAYYALRTSFIPLWDVYLPEANAQEFELEIPTPFKHTHRRAYDKFFERYGTHYVKRAWVGGKANFALTISKTEDMSKADVQASLQASASGYGDANASASSNKNQQNIQNNSQCVVSGKGGDELKLAGLNTLDEQVYAEWLTTIKDNPQVIELEVAGIWTLLDDPEQAKTLATAYKTATSFTPMSAILSIENMLYFICDKKYFCYNLETNVSEKPKPIKQKWPALASIKGFEIINAAFKGNNLIDINGENLDNKLFFFSDEYYVRYDIETQSIDPNYPKKITDGWKNFPFKRIDAALNAGENSLYLFCGNKYVRYNLANQTIDADYPALINTRWNGVTFERIDAAIYWGNGKVYFFHENQYIRYDMTNYRADAGYPRFINSSYVEDWKFF